MSTITQEAIQTFVIDPAHSAVSFTVRHMGFTKVRGHFQEFEGVVHLDPEDLSTLETEAAIEAASITTNETKRDEHLRSEDFFEVESHPTLTFSTTDVREASDDSFILVGELTIRGVTKPVELEGEFLGTGIDPWGNERVAFTAGTTINRKDFGLNWNTVLETGGVLVSEKVDIELEVQAVLQDEESD